VLSNHEIVFERLLYITFMNCKSSSLMLWLLVTSPVSSLFFLKA